MIIKLPEKIIFNNPDDDQFMIIDEIEISDEGLSQAAQFNIHGKIFQIDKDNGTVKEQSEDSVNLAVEINAVYQRD